VLSLGLAYAGVEANAVPDRHLDEAAVIRRQ